MQEHAAPDVTGGIIRQKINFLTTNRRHSGQMVVLGFADFRVWAENGSQ
jgi:isopentenyl phosphate kinase